MGNYFISGMKETNFTPRDDYKIHALAYGYLEESIRMAAVHNRDKFFRRKASMRKRCRSVSGTAES